MDSQIAMPIHINIGMGGVSVLPMGVLTRDRGGGANRNFQAFKLMFFPFVRNSRPGGGGVLSDNLEGAQ